MSKPLAANRNPTGARSRGAKLRKPDIQRRLDMIELAAVSSVRALQMGLDGDDGVPSTVVLKRARAAIR
jgi:hypothetical protein